jgi:NAD(P)-dependent dehydrogenase (short-subunit alcohol dehydrogenase family)
MSDHTPVTVDGKSAVVVGGTSGIGRAIAEGFAADGADVIATSRSADAVAETAAELRDRGAQTAEVTCDVTDRSDIEGLYETAVGTFGGVDVLVNSAGLAVREPLLDHTDEDWERVLEVQLTAVFRAIRTFAAGMDEGAILNLSSYNADHAMAGLVSYAAAKGGVDSVTRVAAKELAPEVRVNAVRPGFILTPQTADAFDEGTYKRQRLDERTPMGRVGYPEEVVGAAIYLASDAASFTTGEILTVDGGFTDSAFE